LPFQAIHFAVERTVATLEIFQAHLLHLRSSSGVADVFSLRAEEAPLRIDYGSYASPSERQPPILALKPI